MNKLPARLRFLIYCEEVKSQKDLEKLPLAPLNYMSDQHGGNIQHFSYFIVNSKSGVKIFTINLFSKKYCNYPKIELINKFDKISLKWKNQLNIQEKFRDFHDCMLSSIVMMQEEQVEIDASALFVKDILKIIAQKGNFVNRFEYYDMTQEKFFPSRDGKFIAPVFYTSIFSTVIMHFGQSHITSAFADTSLIFLMTPRPKYTDWEKVLLPFDEAVWMYLIITFAIAYIIVMLIRLMPQNVHNIVFGERVQHPGFNITGVFFGIGQSRLPIENPSRQILIFFVMFCLIIRTAYQGSDDNFLYNFMHAFYFRCSLHNDDN